MRACVSSETSGTHGAHHFVTPARYHVIRSLGRGGMGDVFLAHDARLDRQVVIKQPRTDFDGFRNRACQSSVLREGRLLACLHHPGVVGIYDMHADGTRHGLVLRHVDGISLDELPPLPAVRVVEIVERIALALAHVHEQGVVHLDLKLENVLLDRSGEPCIIDFGIAQTPGPLCKLPGATGIIGTPRVMAPEHLREDEVGPATDLFALGVLLYELLTGSTPFDASSDAEAIARVMAGQRTRIDRVCTGLPMELVEIVDELLEREPARRPASAHVVAERLADLVQGMRL